MISKPKDAKKIHLIKNNLFITALIFKIAPTRIICELINSFARYGASFFYTVIFWKFLLREDTARSFKNCAVFIIAVLASDLLLHLWLNWYNTARAPIANIKIHMKLNELLFKKASNADIACYETPDFYEKYTRATSEAAARGLAVVKNSSTFISGAVFCLISVYMMLDITPICLPFVLLPLLGHFLISRMGAKHSFEIRNGSTYSRRIYEYVNRTVYLKKYSGEMRMTGIFKVMRRIYDRAFKNIIKILKKHMKKQILILWSGYMFSYVFAFFGMWIVASYLALSKKSIGVEDFIVLAAAISTASNMIGVIGIEYNKTVEDAMFVESLREFLAYKPDIPEDQDGLMVKLPIQTIEFRNVSFKYKNSEKYALRDINLTLKNRTTVAVVGINGSGKSTLIKLLMRLYDPTEGEILLNGINIKEYNIHNYRLLIGAAFQDFALFATSVLENVTLCKIKNRHERQIALRALKESDIYDRIALLKDGVDTILTKEFDDEGAILSGGEGQKVAIARAFCKENPIIILDEPSSALDPIAEFNMYETILKLCKKCSAEKGKISIIVSHRLCAAALSDEILVLKDGRLCEQGSHCDLMKLNGAYADMFKKQAESYLSTEGEVPLNV